MNATSNGGGREDLRRFAREHHVSYDVEVSPPAAKGEGESPFDVRLFATHGEDKLEAPLCPRCVDLARELRSFAGGIVAMWGAAEWAEVLEPPPVLYTATDQHGPDEVSLTMHCLGDRSGPSHLDLVKARLKEIGVAPR